MLHFKLTKEQYTALSDELMKSHQVTKQLLEIIESKGLEEEHIFEEQEVLKVLNFFASKPYNEVAGLLMKILPLDSIEKTKAQEKVTEPPVVVPEIVVSPEEVSLPEQV